MPEGPEIRRVADRIERAVGGRAATQVRFAFPHLKRYEAKLSGRRVRGVETRGKAMLLHFQGGLSVYSHSLLYGRWYVVARDTQPRTRRSLRLAIHNRERSALLYSASEIDVLTKAQIARHPFLSKLGPDVLADDTDADTILARITDPRFARRPLHSLLLDQGFLAGLGNYLRSEVLFEAGLRATRRAGELSEDEARALARSTLEVTRRAYRTGGVTNDLERVAALRAEGMRRRDYRHHVFARDGRKCWTCGAKIRREVLGGRKLFSCPRCQPAPRRSARRGPASKRTPSRGPASKRTPSRGPASKRTPSRGRAAR